MIDDLIKERLKKLSQLKKAGINPYPASVKRTLLICEALKKFSAKGGSALAGRLLSWRDQGGVIFADIADESGKIQLVLKKDTLKNFALFKETLDRGDFLSASGLLFKTKKGQESLDVKELNLLVKSQNNILFPESHASWHCLKIGSATPAEVCISPVGFVIVTPEDVATFSGPETTT